MAFSGLKPAWHNFYLLKDENQMKTSANMKSTAVLWKALDIELKKLLSADIKSFRNKQQASKAAGCIEVKRAA